RARRHQSLPVVAPATMPGPSRKDPRTASRLPNTAASPRYPRDGNPARQVRPYRLFGWATPPGFALPIAGDHASRPAETVPPPRTLPELVQAAPLSFLPARMRAEEHTPSQLPSPARSAPDTQKLAVAVSVFRASECSRPDLHRSEFQRRDNSARRR